MNVMECVKNSLFYLDGGTGTSLQAMGLASGELPELWNLEHPQKVVELERAYFEAGSHAVATNTFGANGLKFDGRDGRPSLHAVIRAAVHCAKEARDTAQGGQKNRFIALDIGPLGRMLEPLGDLSFEAAVELFAEIVRIGTAEGADFVLIETMNDAYETKAAVLAAKENTDLPIFVSNVYDENAKLMTGATPEAMAALLEGLRVDVMGINCSLGPDQMLKLLPRLAACTSLPLLVKPNAGMPHSRSGRTVYDVDAAHFAAVMKQAARQGARVIGGCCGTTPEYIRQMVAAAGSVEPLPLAPKRRSVVSSYAGAVEFGAAPVLIGERINPTGKKRFKEALRAHDIGYILHEGIAQQDRGVQVLDVNVGLPEIDEAAMLAECVRELQAVSNLPLQLDTSDPAAMERAMRIYNGKPMLNSVNGKEESMAAIFPLVQKYGGLVVCLTLDESGIPDTAQGRLAIARRILRRAAEYGIGPEDLIFDPLAMTISSDNLAAQVTLDTVSLLKKELGVHCSLGVSNVSFGLPNREFVTASFFMLALARGLDAAILNPFSAEMQKAYRCYMALSGQDPNCQEYIGFAQNVAVQVSAAAPEKSTASQQMQGLSGAIVHGLREQAAISAREALQSEDGLRVINEQIIPALDAVGQGFEQKTIFLPQLLMSAEAAKAAFDEVRKTMPAASSEGPAVILATVKGDIHDIGKNIVKVLLENYGYRVIDLGRDVPPEKVLETALENDIRLVGLSALMTTTVPAMEQTARLLRAKKPDCRVVVGGAVLTQEYADQIGADHYAKNAMETVRYAQQVLGEAEKE